jgi:hypothetical protein
MRTAQRRRCHLTPAGLVVRRSGCGVDESGDGGPDGLGDRRVVVRADREAGSVVGEVGFFADLHAEGWEHRVVLRAG